MELKVKESFLRIFFGITACSFMPHWACHYYRIETGSSFVIGSWSLTVSESYLFMLFYTLLISLAILSVSIRSLRPISGLVAGLVHLALGVIHIIRLRAYFKFEIFNLEWPLNASLREVLIVIPFGIACLLVSFYSNNKRV